MEVLQASGPNAEQIQYWNELAGAKWVALQPLLDAQIGPLGRRVMERAGIGNGERVLDVGCGCGNTTLEIARRVGPTGAAVGLDISTVMLARARQAAHDAGLSHVRFENADAQTHRFSAPEFDVVFSRFGVMFFTDPVSAFANLATGLRPGGRLGFVCWQALQQNAWAFIPLRAALAHVPAPPVPAPDTPGPFAFADAERVRTLLAGAGFERIVVEAVEAMLDVAGGSDLESTVEFLMQMGPLNRVLRDANGEVRARVAGAVREAVAPFLTAQGVQMPAAAWLVTGRRP